MWHDPVNLDQCPDLLLHRENEKHLFIGYNVSSIFTSSDSKPRFNFRTALNK